VKNCGAHKNRFMTVDVPALYELVHNLLSNIKNIGEAGLIHFEPNVYAVFRSRQHDQWETGILPALKKMRATVVSSKELHQIRAARSSTRLPTPANSFD